MARVDHPQWERFLGPRERGLRGRWMRVYYWERVAIEIERLLIWPEESCAGEPRVLGEPLPAKAPAPQKPPANGIAPRIDLEPVERAAGRLPPTLAGRLGADGLPRVVSARVDGAGEQGLQLTVPAANLPPGGRRAGLTSHWFVPRMHGQEQRINTGWLTSDGRERGLYAPHTKAGTRLPRSRALFDLGAGAATRLGIRGARKLGLTS